MVPCAPRPPTGPFILVLKMTVWALDHRWFRRGWVLISTHHSSVIPVAHKRRFTLGNICLDRKDIIHLLFNILMPLNWYSAESFSARNSHTKDLCCNYLSIITGETVNQHKLTKQIVWNMYLRNKHNINYNEKQKFGVLRNGLKSLCSAFFRWERKVARRSSVHLCLSFLWSVQ